MNHPTEVDLSIAIVSFNTKAWLERCLRSLFDTTHGISFDVWVLDNASEDGSADMVESLFPSVRLIRHSSNKFITEPYNYVLKESRAKYVLISDSDMEFTPQSLANMASYLDAHPDIGALSGCIYNTRGELNQGYNAHNTYKHALFTRTFLSKCFPAIAQKEESKFRYIDWDRKTSREVDVCDACLMVRKAAVLQVGGFDMRLKLYFLQDDLSIRLKKAGWLSYCWTDIHFIHGENQSTGRVSWTTISQIYRQDMFRFYSNWYGLAAASVLMTLVYLTRYSLLLCISLGLYKAKKNMVYGT